MDERGVGDDQGDEDGVGIDLGRDRKRTETDIRSDGSCSQVKHVTCSRSVDPRTKCDINSPHVLTHDRKELVISSEENVFTCVRKSRYVLLRVSD